jgi:hypothetical protein
MDQTTSEYMRMLRLSLRDALQGPLEETSWLFPNFEQRVLDNVRMGLFLYPDRKRPRREHLLEINLAEIAAMEAMLANDFKDELKSRMFSPKIDAIAFTSIVTLDFDFDYKTMTVDVKDASDDQLGTVPSLENWRFVPTLPPVFVVFGFTPHYSEVEDWQWAMWNLTKSGFSHWNVRCVTDTILTCRLVDGLTLDKTVTMTPTLLKSTLNMVMRALSIWSTMAVNSVVSSRCVKLGYQQHSEKT